MKRLKLLALIMSIVSSCLCNAQKISDTIVLDNGLSVGKGHIFLDGEDCVLTSDAPVQWRFLLSKEYHYFDYNFMDMKDMDFPVWVKMVESDGMQDSFHIIIDKINWHWTHRIDSDIDDSVYFDGMVQILINGEVRDSMPMRFNLLPSKPQIIDVKLDYVYNWEYGDFDIGIFEITVVSHRATKYQLLEHQRVWQYEFPGDGPYYVSDIPIDYPSEEPTCLVNDVADWGQYHRVGAANKYDIVWYPGNISTLDYVTDPQVLADIEKHRPITDIDNCPTSIPNEILILNNTVFVKGDFANLKIQVYNLSGHLIKSQEDNNMDVSDLPRGWYIIKAFTSNNKPIITKIHKQ